MDTKEKNREAARQESRRRPDARVKNTEEPVHRPVRQNPSPDAAGQRTGERRTSSGQAKPRKQGAPSQTRTAPQGNARRKSAPNPDRPEQVTRAVTAKPRTGKKKTGVLGLFSGSAGKKKPRKNLTPEERAEKRRREEAAAAERKQRLAVDQPPVVYTQPAPFNRDKLLIQLLSIAAVVVAVILGMSVFFKVKYILVAGAETYSTYAIQQASGIVKGDNLLTFSKAGAVARIHAEHAYVDDVRIGIKLPDTVIIYIEELDVAYSINSINDGWWLINSDGKVVDQINEKESDNYTKVEGVTLDSPQIGVTGVAAEAVTETLESGEPVPVTVTGAQRLSAALQILKALEENDIVGEAASVDVASLEDITLWYGSRYEVLLGNIDRMDYKIACMNDAILQMSDYQSGILDVTFTTWINQVGYTPFG